MFTVTFINIVKLRIVFNYAVILPGGKSETLSRAIVDKHYDLSYSLTVLLLSFF